MNQQQNHLSNIIKMIDELSNLCDSKEDVKMLNAVRNTCKKLDEKRSSKEILVEGPLRNLLENQCQSIFEERDKKSAALTQNLEKNVDQNQIEIRKNSELLSGFNEELEKLRSETKTLHNNLIGEISSVGENAKSRIKSESERQTTYFSKAEEKHEQQIEGINRAIDELDDRVNTGVVKLEESISNHESKLQDQQTSLNKTNLDSKKFEDEQRLLWKIAGGIVVLLIILDLIMGTKAAGPITASESPKINSIEGTKKEMLDDPPSNDNPIDPQSSENDGNSLIPQNQNGLEGDPALPDTKSAGGIKQQKPGGPANNPNKINQQPSENGVIPSAGPNQKTQVVDPKPE